MRIITRVFLAVSFVGTIALAVMTPVNAQYYQLPPDYGYHQDVEWVPAVLDGSRRRL
jgi:hypothetical protein